jgi:hypothetical protein
MQKNQRLSWVEWLAFAFMGVGVALLMSRDMIADLAPTAKGSWLDPGGAAFGLGAIMGGTWLIAAGLSLFLVKPLLRVGRDTPLWLIPLTGAVLEAGALVIPSESVCPQWPIECELGLLAAPPFLIVFGIVLLIRKAQVFRKREPGTGMEQSS